MKNVSLTQDTGLGGGKRGITVFGYYKNKCEQSAVFEII